ncbi:MAG: hypothetical protein RML35_12110 [Chloroherpetonaceae bacterium]|nr:hypothetical protein [Chloroherpetonaceae bacterium]
MIKFETVSYLEPLMSDNIKRSLKDMARAVRKVFKGDGFSEIIVKNRIALLYVKKGIDYIKYDHVEVVFPFFLN